jgi:hypothetical protein
MIILFQILDNIWICHLIHKASGTRIFTLWRFLAIADTFLNSSWITVWQTCEMTEVDIGSNSVRFFWGICLGESLNPPPPVNSQFKFQMFMNQVACKCCPVFGMRLNIVLICVESPLGLTLISDECQNCESSCDLLWNNFLNVWRSCIITLYISVYKQCELHLSSLQRCGVGCYVIGLRKCVECSLLLVSPGFDSRCGCRLLRFFFGFSHSFL